MAVIQKRKKDESKADAFRRIYHVLVIEEQMERKDALPLLMEKCELSKAAAQTYWANERKRLASLSEE